MIFPVRDRTSSTGSLAAAGKIGAFIGIYALTSFLPRIGLAQTSGIVGFIGVLGAVITLTTRLFPNPIVIPNPIGARPSRPRSFNLPKAGVSGRPPPDLIELSLRVGPGPGGPNAWVINVGVDQPDASVDVS